eukprot:scaffold124803_cov33-Phaeocystis_antarctica.AAC.2
MCDFKARRSPRAHLDTALRKLLRKLRPPARSQGASDILADRRVRVCHVEKATTGGQDRCRPRRYLASSMVSLLPSTYAHAYRRETQCGHTMTTLSRAHSQHSECSQTPNVGLPCGYT